MYYFFFEKRLVCLAKHSTSKRPSAHPDVQKGRTEKAEKKDKKEQLQKKRDEKKQQRIKQTKQELAHLKVHRQKLSPKEQKQLKQSIRSFDKQAVERMLRTSSSTSIYDLRRGGTLRLLYEREKNPTKKAALKKKLQENQGYARMIAQFAKEKQTKEGKTYLEVDLKNIDRYEMKLGAGHICPYNWVKVAIEDTEGNVRTGYRKVPGVDEGVYGSKIGYYTDTGAYLPVFSGYKIYPLEIKDDPKQLKKEQAFYKQEKQRVRESRSSSPSSSTREDYEQAKASLAGSNKSQLAEQGITPFPVRMGYRMTPEERAVYMREYKEARRLSRMSMKERLAIMQERYRLKDALERVFKALRIDKRHKDRFYAYNDAVMYIESRYNPIAVNRRNGKIALSTATGAYQILNSVWKSTCNKWFRNTKKARYYKKYYNRKVPPKYRIDFDALGDIDFDKPLPGLATPYEHAIFHNVYAFKGSRLYRGVMAFDEVFDRLDAGGLSPEMRYSYQAYLYTNWRNGHSGAKVFLRMMKKGIPFPRNKAEAREYFDQMPNCWQKRRGFRDFSTLVRACRAFVGRFNKNMREQGVS
ncbi:hypothetical protein GF369_00625 [Candidatus Peregrinibacteria bacterium]|nr:hypothetical protein [Candidatus Peregrinibacteria bacterium]